MDTDENVIYWYGGANSDLSTSNKVEATDLSGAGLSASARQVSGGSALLVVGAAGAYRAKGAKADGSAAYFFGGLKDGNNGLAINNIQRYVTKTGKWEQVSVPTGSLIPRAWATATYDPVHDVMWVVGGVSSCQMQPVIQGQPCQARSLAIQYLTFDAATGEPKEWKNLAIETASFAGVAVYDSTMKRLILHGRTSDTKTGSSTLQALDLTDADPGAAKLANLTATGTAPSLYFHGGAYDAAHNWLVVYGGVKRNYFQSNESTDTTTMALDLGAAPSPAWKNLSPTGNPGERVGGGLVYDPKHMAVIETLGRTKISFTSGTPPMPAPEVSKAIQALTCTTAGAPTATAVPPTSVPGGPTATPRPTSPVPSEPGPDDFKACRSRAFRRRRRSDVRAQPHLRPRHAVLGQPARRADEPLSPQPDLAQHRHRLPSPLQRLHPALRLSIAAPPVGDASHRAVGTPTVRPAFDRPLPAGPADRVGRARWVLDEELRDLVRDRDALTRTIPLTAIRSGERVTTPGREGGCRLKGRDQPQSVRQLMLTHAVEISGPSGAPATKSSLKSKLVWVRHSYAPILLLKHI